MAGVLQAVVYSKATGRVRRVVDPAPADPASACQSAGEAVLLMRKRLGRPNTLLDWQVLASRAAGKRPVPIHPTVDAHVTATARVVLTDAPDRYCVIDVHDNIVGVVIADPACGDAGEHFGVGCTLVPHATADERWSYAAGVFTAPTWTVTKEGRTYTVSL